MEPNTDGFAGFDPTDPDLVHSGRADERFRELRKVAPVYWVEQEPDARAGMDGPPGFWAVTSHELVRAVSKNSAAFSSFANGSTIRLPANATREDLEGQRTMLINADAPAHTQLRTIISRGFTPRSIAALEDSLSTQARDIVEGAVKGGTGNFVEDIASELPLGAIADFLDVPSEDRRRLFDWSNQLLGYEDPDYEGDALTASIEIITYFQSIAEQRRLHPGDDLVSKLIHAEVGDHALSADEFSFFVILLVVAGNETTRNAITHGMNAFLENPDSWDLYRKHRPGTAVDEIIRWATPVRAFQRTAVEKVDLGSVTVRPGERVGLFYCAANFDESVFADPFRFDILRDPNPHLSFGGSGAHYCIGANLARLQVKIMFETLADLAPDIRKLGEPQRLRSSWLNGIKDLPVAYS